MVAPLIVGGAVVAFSPSDSGSTDEIMSEVGFNHPEKYGQITNGQGTTALHSAISGWQGDIARDFDEVAHLLDDANSKAGVAWTGEAAEQHGSSLKPMSNFVRDSKEISTSVGMAATEQATAFGNVRNGMPEPVKVDATDSLAEKGGAWLVGGETDLQKQERQATEKAEEAKRFYETYNTSIKSSSQGLPRYPEAPQMSYDQGEQATQQRAAVNGTVGAGTSGTAQSIGGTGMNVTGGSAVAPPASTGSDWASPSNPLPSIPSGPAPGTPPIGGTPGPTPGPPPIGTLPSPGPTPRPVPLPAPGPVQPPKTGPGRPVTPPVSPPRPSGPQPGKPTGGRPATPVTGTSGGSGGGAGARGGGSLAGSGRAGGGLMGGSLGAGAGGKGAFGAAAGAGARGAGAGYGPMARGRGQEGEEDGEHENKYVLETDEAWEELGLPKVAPPVIGGNP